MKAIRQAYTTVKPKSGVVGNYGLTRGSEAGVEPLRRPRCIPGAHIDQWLAGRAGAADIR